MDRYSILRNDRLKDEEQKLKNERANKENWYYFDYRLGTLNVSTSDGPFLDILLEVKANNRSIKEDGKRFGFQAMGSPKRRNDFVDRFREFD